MRFGDQVLEIQYLNYKILEGEKEIDGRYINNYIND